MPIAPPRPPADSSRTATICRAAPGSACTGAYRRMPGSARHSTRARRRAGARGDSRHRHRRSAPCARRDARSISAIACGAFAGGGLVLEAGAGGQRSRRPVGRLPFPPTWRCVVVVPQSTRGLSGEPRQRRSRGCRRRRTGGRGRSRSGADGAASRDRGGDLPTFGAALSAVQGDHRRWFGPVQGGAFASGPSEELVRRMAEWECRALGRVPGGSPSMACRTAKRPAVDLPSARGVRARRVYEGPFPRKARGCSVAGS